MEEKEDARNCVNIKNIEQSSKLKSIRVFGISFILNHLFGYGGAHSHFDWDASDRNLWCFQSAKKKNGK